MSKGLDGITKEFKKGNDVDINPQVNEAYFNNLEKILRLEKKIGVFGVGTIDVTPEAALQIELQTEKLRLALKYGKEYAETWVSIEAATKKYQFELGQKTIEAKMMQQVKALDYLKENSEEYNSVIKTITFSYQEMERNSIDRRNQESFDDAALKAF